MKEVLRTGRDKVVRCRRGVAYLAAVLALSVAVQVFNMDLSPEPENESPSRQERASNSANWYAP